MSRTRRIFIIAALIVFGLLAPAQSDAVLTHCTGPWSGADDTFETTCWFKLGGGAIDVNGLAVVGSGLAKVDVTLIGYPPSDPSPVLLAQCSNAGQLVTQCSGAGNYAGYSTQWKVACVITGRAVLGFYSCRTV